MSKLETPKQERIGNIPGFIQVDEPRDVSSDFKQKTEELIDRLGVTEYEADTFLQYVEMLNIGDIESLNNKTILDIGSGSGAFKKVLERMIFPRFFVNLDNASVDLWEGRMDVQGDVKQLPFKDESFDYILMHCSVPIMQATTANRPWDIPVSIREAVRVLKPGGTIKIYPGFMDIASAARRVDGFFLKKYGRMNAEVLLALKQLHEQYPQLRIKLTAVHVREYSAEEGKDSLLEITK
ncbi:MAG: hypothetical protein A2728_03135 [Candidatus Spechtbacteria bacterium RIFCSPHIGHO2_01_FULL_38_11]|nr:MAG: hypothetical protein A2728_03135 [Candidatus Spechtbacteria bacterium RIFCSPHIGHO2_01_FULL_38_11]